ncbi:MAG: polysaccharide deacetylase family protein [Leptospirales bacterium]
MSRKSKSGRSTPLGLFIFLLSLLLSILFSAPFCMASAAEPYPQSYQRTVLVLFNELHATPDINYFRGSWEFPLNFLGLKAEYRNLLTEPLPSDSDIQRFRAVILSLSSRVQDPASLWKFMQSVQNAGKRLIILGDIPPYRTSSGKPFDSAFQVLARMGFRRVGHWDRKNLRYSTLRSSMIGFEVPPPPLPSSFRPLMSIRSENTVWIGVRSANYLNRGIISPQVVTGPFGGIAVEPFITQESPLNPNKEGWIVNPFLFLETALDIRKTPRVDLTTLNGSRIFYSQVDGDGFETLSRYREGQMCAEVLYHEVFTRYSLPFSASVIVSQIDPHYQGTKNRVKLARKIFALPNVEAASHTFSHPFYWNPTAAQKAEGPVHIQVPGYHFNLDQEVRISLDWMNRNLLPPGKKVALYQWSGDGRPRRETLQKVWAYPILNMNGSDTQFDAETPSYLFVFPYYRKVGPYIQFFNSDANEYILTHDWKGPFFAYANILETFAHTESPRRVDPINVYFHFYIAQKEASLHSLEQVLDWVTRQQIAPLFSSEFVRVEEGYINTRIHQISDGSRSGWRFSRYGRDTTIRFDHASGLYPDFKRSRGILGYRHQQGSLYLLLALRPSATLFLTSKRPSVPFLHSATGYLLFSRRPHGRISFTYEGWEPGNHLELSGFPPGKRMSLLPCIQKTCSAQAGPSGNLQLSGLKRNVPYLLAPSP